MLYGDEDCPMYMKVEQKKKEDANKMSLMNEITIETIANLIKDNEIDVNEILLLIKGVILHNRAIFKNVKGV